MKAFKGFNKDLTCRGFQYEEGKEFHTEKADCCNEGFHACEYPLDCFGYYNPAESVFHETWIEKTVIQKYVLLILKLVQEFLLLGW